MWDVIKLIKKQQTKDNLISVFMGSLDERVDRYLDISHQWIIGGHYFAKASSECIELYRDSYFIAALMLSHAINEAIIKFVVERNPLIKREDEAGKTKSIELMINELEENKIISKECADVSRRIWGNHRNDVHHLNSSIAAIDFAARARENLLRLAVIEKEIFEVDRTGDGKIRPHKPQYWDLNKDGTVNVFIRLE